MSDLGSRDMQRMLQSNKMADRRNFKNMVGKGYYGYFMIALTVLCTIWYFAAHAVDRPFTFPYFESVVRQLATAVTDMHVIRNIGITLRRVATGVLIGAAIGYPLGMLMGYVKPIMQTIAPFINSFRQIPTTTWVPLAIVWFGLGDGPTIFIIAFQAVFAIILNTVAGVKDISGDFYNAAQSMGATKLAVIKDIVLPGSMSGLITGIRIALGTAWMTVV